MAINVETVRTGLGVIGNAISLFLFLCPIPTFVKIVNWRSTRDFSALPYVLTLLNCLLWIFYGLPAVHPHSLLVLTINSAGAFFETIYIIVFFILASRNEKSKLMAYLVAVMTVFTANVFLTLTFAHSHETRTLMVGSVCAVIGTCMYSAPLTVMKRVIKTKSVEYMPFSLSLASFLNGLVWTAYATLKFDVFVTIPNAVGIVLGACQLVLYATYYRRTGRQESMEAGLPTNVPPRIWANNHEPA